MSIVKLAVTDLDSWLAYTRPEIEAFEISTEQLIARLRRMEPPSVEMRAGQAFHTVMERLLFEGELEYAEQDGIEFDFALDSAISLPDLREANIEREYMTDAGTVLLRGRIDGRTADLITDYKLTFGSFDGERYGDSMQWRAYLDMTGARRFRHLVFQASLKDKRVTIYDMHALNQWAYGEPMHDYVADIAGQLAAFVRIHVPERVIEAYEQVA